MPNAPKRKATTNASTGREGSSANTFKRSTSNVALGTRADSKLSQPTLSTFFTKARVCDASGKEAPLSEEKMGTKSSYSLVSSPVINTSSAPRAITSTASLTKTHTTIKPRRTIILDEDGGNNGGNSHNTDPRQERIAARSVLAARPSRPTSRAEILNRHSTGDRKRSMGLKPLRKEDDETLPFEERMPVSPPGSPGMNARPPLFQEPKQDALITAQQDPRVESISASMIAPSEIMNTGPSSGPCSTNTGPSTPPKKSDSNCNTSTSVNTPPQRSKKNPSPFRTPDKSRRSRSAMESLGLSPQDSVFWVRTPPMEALKKLGRMNTGQSHEEEVASIVGRLYQTSSAGAALRSMPRGPKDRIKDMLNTIRMSSAPPFQDLHEDLDDTEDGDPASPTKKLMERRKNVSNSRQSLVKSNTALERGRAGRRYGRAHQYNKKTLNQLSPNHSTPCPQRREDILKMIDQINANMAAPSNPGTSDSDDEAAPLDSRSSIRPTESDSVPKTPLRDLVSASSQLHFSPGEFDNFFDDLDMDDHDFEELTQLELVSSMSPGFAAADMSISSVSTSAASCGGGDRTFYDVRQELSELGRERAENLREGWRNVTDSVADNVTTTTDTTAEPEGAGLSLNEELIVEEVTEYQERINIKKASTLSSGDFDDFADLGDDFELEDDDLYDTPLTFNVQAHIDSVKYRRFKIIKIMDGIMDPRWYGPSKALFVTDDRNQTPAKIFLRDSWMTSRIDIGDIVHTISAFIYKLDILELMLDDHQGFLIVKPDSLVSTSVLAESFNCIRKPIIDIRARKTDETTVPLIHGTMLHELFQQSLRSNDFSTESMEARLDDIIKLHLNDLCLISESIDVARERISELIPACQDWARKYLRNSPCAEAIVDNTMGHTLNNEYSLLCVNKILDIEENIWSPMFGLKGKIDASIQVVLKTMKKNMDPAIAETKILTVPFELKTGKKSNVISHRAQTMLYTLLMTDRYDVDVQWGLLFYLKAGELIRVNAPHDQIRAILFQRNEIAAYEEQKLSLPPMVQDSQKCGRCFSFSSCTVLHKLLEDGTAESSGLGAMFDEVTDHLSSTHAEFLRKWNRLLALEQGDVAKFQSQIWSMLSVDRQASGNCFSNLELIEEPKESNNRPRDLSSSKDIEFSMSGRFARHQYRFKLGAPPSSLSQQTLSQTLRGGLSLLSSNISVGDPIVVSSEGNHFALAMGYVLDMSLTEITVGLDRPLLGPPMRLEGFDQERNQSYRGLISIENPVPSSGNTEEYYSNLAKNKVMFRLDKDEMSAGIARTRNNLVQLFRADADGGDSKRRRLIVDLERPEFEPIHDFKRQDLLDLNGDQCRAVEAVLAARDYALILGMPGTGKTTTIAQIIHILVRQGKSVLLTSYTHSAVDNVLLKFLKLGQRPDTNVVRLGNKDRVHRDIQRLIPDFSQPPLNTVEAIHNFYGRCQVVGTTCLGIGDPLFTEKRFDYCIVDEASQITLPACLGPIRYADIFVLVGDHNQLPPLVKNVEAKEDGFDQSLFKMLSDRYPEAVTSLTQQYRMNKDVMLLSNTLVYENQLKCATEEVANKVLDIPSMNNFRDYCHYYNNSKPIVPTASNGTEIKATAQCFGHSRERPCWLEQILNPKQSVVFVDTDDVPAREIRVGHSTQNPTEALLVRQLVEAFIGGGISEQDIGIISVLRAQLKVLSRLLRTRPLLDIHTVDRYQGKDKECVIVSLVRSNTEQQVGELLKDWRRINVAFTRAKRKLVVFGSRQTLQGSPVFEQFLRLMEQQQWTLKLQPMAQNQHPCLSQVSTTSAATAATKVGMLSSLESKETGCVKMRQLGVLDEGAEKGDDGDEEVTDKENIIPTVNSMKATTYARGKDTEKENKEKGCIDVDSNRTRRQPKVSRLHAETVLKKMPIVKNIVDSM